MSPTSPSDWNFDNWHTSQDGERVVWALAKAGDKRVEGIAQDLFDRLHLKRGSVTEVSRLLSRLENWNPRPGDSDWKAWLAALAITSIALVEAGDLTQAHVLVFVCAENFGEFVRKEVRNATSGD